MNPWRWIRSRRWWIQLSIAIVTIPVMVGLLYVSGRTLQYYASEHEGGLYVPAGANVVLRTRGLEGHVRRMKGTAAWRALDRRVLHDPVLRREIDSLLTDAGAPTLEDLEDERKPFARNQARVLDLVGDDLIAALMVKDEIPKATFCVIVRLRWIYYLATPFAGIVLPTESQDGQTCVVLRQGAQELRIALVGSLAIVANDKALLGQALRRQGKEADSERPLAVRLSFDGSSGLLRVRRAIQDSGALPYVNWATARGLTLWADLRDSMLTLDAQVDRAEPLHPGTPPVALRSWTPVSTTGLILTNTGGADLMAWVESLVHGARPQDLVALQLKQALQALDEGGLKTNLLPQLQDGMAVITGAQEREGRSYTTFVLLLPSGNPVGAVEAINGIVRKIAGNFGDSKYFGSVRVGDVTLNSWAWPDSLQINDLLSPTYGVVKDLLVLGNNKEFTTQVVQTALDGGGGFEETSEYRKLRTRMKEEGFSAAPALAGGFFFPPLLRASLDGSLPLTAKQLVYGSLNGPALRAEVEAELRRQGTPTESSIVKAYNEAVERRIEEKEAALRRNFEPMNAVRWAAFEAQNGDSGIRFHSALEFR